MVNIKLKWNKLTFDCAVNDSTEAFKSNIFQLTGVPVDRQKLMAKGAWIGTLKDGDSQALVKLKDNATVMLMGTADVIVKPDNVDKKVFVEDMTAEELAQKGVLAPAGMVNLGNTCYMNATLQCFRHMPEVRSALSKIPSHSRSLATSFAQTCDDLDRSPVSIPPFGFVHHLRTNFPQFAEMSQGGGGMRGYVQQDAEEFYNTLIAEVQAGLHSLPAEAVTQEENSFNSLLGLRLQETVQCQESDQEPILSRSEEVNKLVCNIQNTVNHMHESVKLGLESTVEKHSAVLGRDALWKKTQRVASLSRYICFQFLRFFWKATPESRDHRGVKCKILRAVSFPETIDMFDLCTEELQQILRANRERAEKAFSQAMGLGKAGDSSSSSSSSSSSGPAPETTMDVDVDDSEEQALQAALKLSMEADSAAAAAAPSSSSSSSSPSSAPSQLGPGLPADFTGCYELHSVVTHKGRSADSGHYMGYVRQGSSNQWWCFNDEKVLTDVTTADVLLLCGGGDRDIAYLTFYKFKASRK